MNGAAPPPRRERRQQPRARLALTVEFLYRAEARRCTTRDAGAGGFFVYSAETPFVGTLLSFRLTHPDLPGPLELTGAVVYCTAHPSGFGVQIRQLRRESEPVFDAYQALIRHALATDSGRG